MPRQVSLNNNKRFICIKRTQLPLIPAFALTTHKCQGQTLQRAVIDLDIPSSQKKKEVAHVYVPLSRCGTMDRVGIIRDFPLSAIQVKPTRAQKDELDRLDKMNDFTKKNFC